MSNRKFCYVCGDGIEERVDKSVWCASCDQAYYFNPSPCVEVALFNNKGEVLVCTRAHEPFRGKLDLPGGFVEDDETAEQALLRELNEEMGIEPKDISQLQYLTSYHTSYPWGNVTYSILVVEFVAVLNDGVELKPNDDVAAVVFLDPNNLVYGRLSLPDIYSNIIPKAVSKMQEIKQ